MCASSLAEYGPCLFFQSGNFQGVGIVVKISVKNLSHRKVLSPHSSKSQLFSRAPAPSSSPESLNFHLRIKITALRPQSSAWAGLGGIGLISASPNGTCQEESIETHPSESLSKPKPSQKATGGNGTLPCCSESVPNGGQISTSPSAEVNIPFRTDGF